MCAVSAARAAPWGRLETVQKVLTQGVSLASRSLYDRPIRVLSRLMLYTVNGARLGMQLI